MVFLLEKGAGMSEKSYESGAKVIRFPVEGFVDPAELEDKEIIERFLAQLRHPGAPHDSLKLAEFIQEIAGQKSSEGLPANLRAWRDRMLQIRMSTGWSDGQYDAIINTDDEKYDEGFIALYDALVEMRPRMRDFEEQRGAVMTLMDLRVTAINKCLNKTDDWEKLANLLSSEPS